MASQIVSLASACQPARRINDVQHDLDLYISLLKKWSKAYNLLSLKDMDQLMPRHIENAWQICPYLSPDKPVVDLGTGAGLPGMVLAILGYDPVFLVEKNGKKCTFLKEVIRTLQLKNVQVFKGRLEDFSFAEVGSVVQVVARGFSSLENICSFLEPHNAAIDQVVLLKGGQAAEEIQAAAERFLFTVETHPDSSLKDGAIVQLRGIVSKRL